MRALGAGASATVFAVRDREHDALRALKLLREGEDEALLRAEFAELSRLQSPHLVRVHDLVRIEEPLQLGGREVAGRLCLLSELCEGVAPAEALARTRAAERDAWLRQLAEDLASALAEVHGAGLVHHDVKPANVLFAEGRGGVLLDLGLATRGAVALEGARGTPSYLAPEALAGSAEPSVDLYGLGATLFELAEARPPFAGEGAALIRAILEEQPALRASWLSPELRALVLSLLAKRPRERPGSAQSVLVELARLRGDDLAAVRLATRRTLSAPTELVGRDAELAALAAALSGDRDRREPTDAEAAGCRVVCVHGAPGAGKSALCEEALRRHRLRAAAGLAPARELLRGTLPSILERIGATGEARTIEELALHAALRLEEHAAGRALVLLLEAELGDPLALRLLELVAASEGAVLVIVEGADLPASLRGAPRVHAIEVGPLGEEAIAALVGSMLGGDPPPGLAARIAGLCEGNATLAVELTRTWHLEGESGVELGRIASLDALLARTATALAPEELDLLAVLARYREPASAATLARLLGARRVEPWARRLQGLARRQLLRLGAGAARLPSAAHAEAWERLTRGRAVNERAHRRAAAELEATPASELRDARLARHLLALAEPRGVELALAAGRALAARHAPLAALPLLEQALPHAAGASDQALRETLAELCVQAGRYDRAIELLDSPACSQAGRLLRAQALQRRGDYAEAEQLLRALGPSLAPAERFRALALLGRLLLGQGRTREAREATAPALVGLGAGESGPILEVAGLAAILEVAGLAALYAGELEEADRIFARGEQALASGPPSQLARFVSLRGMVATSAGRPVEASALYRRALALVEAGGDAHGRATYRANLASTLLELGELGEALERLSEAVSDLERLARTGELAGALCNLANLYLLLGDTAAAGRQLGRARALAERLGSRKVLAFVEQLEGDRARVAREPLRALERYRAALSGLAETGTPHELALCELARIDALAEAGRLAEARAALEARPLEGELSGALAVSWVRLQLAGGGACPEACLPLLAGHCAELERRGLRKDLWRAAALLGRALRAAGERAAARAALGRARQSWEGIVHATPESHRALIKADPEARALESEWSALGEASEGAPSTPAPDRDEIARTRRLLAINKRLNSELRLPRLLEAIMDTVIELTEAERGFLLLSRKDGTLAVKVARNIDRRSLEGAELALSRSIAERAARAGAPIVTVDALSDGRFQQALSVSDLHLRSVLAVPLAVKGRVVGTVYIDNRLRGGVFGEAEVRLVQDIADQAAIAIENARLLAANRRKRKLIVRLNRALSRRLETKQAELLEVREELRSSREALQTRHEYGAIVGRSPRMRELFQLLDRVSETELPVVILGESGTGKELVARAVHQHGPRAERPFVSENCAAIPETLLESILFGHVRGAFTGADRDRKGLFEVASGGTLFLDEVGEMSPAMQTKLLRVLQDGELRRVGGTQTLRTDVRVIAASNKDLAALVEAGRFREDLFYRLNVIQVRIPPLRDRREDIPLLCDHFLEKHAGGQGRRLSPEALARLTGYAWPGNVRELENEVMRAAALAGRVIQARDLSPAIAGSAPLALGVGGDLQLKARVEHLERELIAQSLRLAAGNHTQAARALGLSRFGLLKKIRRYGMEDA